MEEDWEEGMVCFDWSLPKNSKTVTTLLLGGVDSSLVCDDEDEVSVLKDVVDSVVVVVVVVLEDGVRPEESPTEVTATGLSEEKLKKVKGLKTEFC